MTTLDIINYYASLLIIQYRGLPKASGTIANIVTPIIMDQLPTQIQNAFDPNTAVGVQLDTVAKYVGVKRTGYGLEGQPITLNDSDFRQLMKLVIIKNNSGSSLGDIQGLLSANFQGQILVSDNTLMHLNYVVLESLGTSDLLELIVTGGYLPKPMGVGISVTVLPVFDKPVFGFRTYSAANPTAAPFNTYPFYNVNYHWLSYHD